MNRTKIKNYAPQARRDFISAVTDRAAHFGLTDTKTEPVGEVGDGVMIGGKAFPKKVGQQRKRLEERVKQHGFSAAMEALAYTWFNRLVAVRFMEVNGYLVNGENGAGYRVLSNPNDKPTPELLEHAEHAALPGLNKSKVIDLKIAGNKDAELYRMLLVAQCNALHTAMPFLFERIDDETELVLPESLLHTDSMIRKLATEIDEEDWKEVEIIGWLYEAYVSERYEQVIGGVVASEDIPAATQRFTPKWIVRYLVQNTLGRTWLATYPHSDVRGKMKYYIEPAEQTPEVRDQLKAITPADLNPEEITFLDPACGSAHILVEAYDLFKLIYQEKGYDRRRIPALILTKNLFGLEIDDRAAQLAAFALLMKARADDRRLFEAEVKVRPNVLALQETKGLDAADVTSQLNEPVVTVELPPSDRLFEADDDLLSKANLAVAGDLVQADIAQLIQLCEKAKTFGSLIRIPPKLAEKLPQIEDRVRLVARHGEGFTQFYADSFLPIVEQAKLLARRYSCVVANPPYMGSKYYSPTLRKFMDGDYKESKADLCNAFIERAFAFVEATGLVGEITMQSWMFLANSEKFRIRFITERSIYTMAHLGPHAFPNIGGQVVQVTVFVASPQRCPNYRGSYKRLIDGQSHEKEARFHTLEPFTPCNADFEKIPGNPVAYWVSDPVRSAFSGLSASKSFYFGQTTKTTDNGRYTRCWWELTAKSAGDRDICRPLATGGEARKWYGNRDWLIRWDSASRQHYQTGHNARITPSHLWMKSGITWTDITGGINTFRHMQTGDIPSTSGPAVYTDQDDGTAHAFLAFLNSKVAPALLQVINPTLHVNPQDVLNLPLPVAMVRSAGDIASELIAVAKSDWNAFETSWEFATLPVLAPKVATLQEAQEIADAECQNRFRKMKEREEENNSLFIETYKLGGELTSEVPDDQITLYRPNRVEDTKRLVSYAIGCMMGRYSFDKPGLMYAHAGNEGFDLNQYTTFPADRDGILPITELDWGFLDDTAKRIEEFVGVAWPKEHQTENLKFIEDGLGTSIRKYLATGFYKDHLRWYKRRPIYWLFSSGKLRASQCLVYLHRYHEGTLARMRTEYVNPLQSKIAARLDTLDGDIEKAKGSLRTKLVREQEGLKKQQAELSAFDDKLKNAADRRIKLDLDDGVKVNYGKFGDLLAESKAVTGGKDDE